MGELLHDGAGPGDFMYPSATLDRASARHGSSFCINCKDWHLRKAKSIIQTEDSYHLFA